MSTYSEHLRARSDEQLVDLLLRRPDLAHPSPATLSSLAARATSRPSLDRALAQVDAGVLQVVEAVVVLDDDAGVRARTVVAAVGGGRGDGPLVRERLRIATELALLYPVAGGAGDPALRAAPGLAEALGPTVAGLSAVRSTVEVGRVSPAARAVLDALTWGPPVGRRPVDGPGADAAAELIAAGLVVEADGGRVVLPRDVALRLRNGRTHRGLSRPPVATDLPRRRPEVVAAESAAAAERAVRLVATLVDLWAAAPPAVLRAGGVGVRDLRRTAQQLAVSEAEAALLIELAAVGGLVRDDGEERPHYLPTAVADEWAAGELPERWAALATWWRHTTRWPALVGGRDDRGQVRPALGPELARPWAPRLRQQVLATAATLDPGSAPDAAAVRDLLGWQAPRAVPPLDAVQAVLDEAGVLGLLGAGALAGTGRAVARDADLPAALAADLPPAVDDLLLQGDLTGIVPGRPSAELDRLIAASAVVESRGGAVTIRFTPESVRVALDAGTTADDLLAELARHTRGGVPQPLEYLVRDAARRHGLLRGGSATSYVRTEDPALLAGVAEDPRLAGLGLVRLAPTVLAAQVPLIDLLAALRARGLAPVAETPDGRVLHTAPTVQRIPAARQRPQDRVDALDPRDRAATLVQVLRRGEAAVTTDARTGPRDRGTDDPGTALATLREAAADHAEVWLELVGPRGALERRRVRPLRVDGGRVRVMDTARDAEIVVAAHRVAGVTRLTAAEPEGVAP
ncbi:helicase-associated domain-containing protein [Cellulomonas sp. RIT-PI-Y]|uniref:helicase-associated domain-containing protein n=1 Tax=Cellulomonas sp. RIT-PI-Y TaxID=3035297 RepID=UPI0021D98442|nr:helicase-associated domain-containing protein [Cellulomonas sp. RIT-PI-Y]